jgi:arginine-tRNA-protein transferase
MISIPLALSQEHPCGYLEAKTAQSLFIHPSYPITSSTYNYLLKQGFRRSGDEVYAPHCSHCSACIPARLPLTKFKPSKNQLRCLRKNNATLSTIKPAIFEQAHYDMYLRYQAIRHPEGSMINISPDNYLSFLSSSWCNTKFVEFSINNELAGVTIIDQFDDAWSAVHTFFEPKFSSYSLGVYAILWQIHQASLQGKEFLYLGFWIEACTKMSYKTNYQPIELLIDKQWLEMKA